MRSLSKGEEEVSERGVGTVSDSDSFSPSSTDKEASESLEQRRLKWKSLVVVVSVVVDVVLLLPPAQEMNFERRRVEEEVEVVRGMRMK